MTLDRYETILLFGPPGSGKGTLGKVLGTIPGIYHIACGDVFRRLDLHSELGRVFLEHSSRGDLVPGDLTVKIWSQHMDREVLLGAYRPATEIMVLDGLPRTVEQAELVDSKIEVLKVLHLVCPDEDKMIERLRRRAIKENRFDDAKESVIRHRWEVYRLESAPVLDHYAKEIVVDIDAIGTPAEVLERTLRHVIPVQNAMMAAISGVKS